MNTEIIHPSTFSLTESSSYYSLIEDDFFHRDFTYCRGEITVFFCIYSITEPFYVEGMPSSDNNIYGRVLPKYNIRYPCLQWIAARGEGHIVRFPSIKYECPLTYEEESESDEKSQETILFENEIHQYFLSLFKDDIYSTDILSSAYKGFSYDESNATAYVFYDFSPIYDDFVPNDTHILVLSEELKEEPVFTKYPFLMKIHGYYSPSLLYMCIYDKEKETYVNVDIHMEPSKYMFPTEHRALGCTAYYFTETPLDENADSSHLVRFACIQSRIMYEIRIDDDGEIYYMGDNVGDFKEDFEMGVLMCSTLHFEEKGRKWIAIKNAQHVHQ